MQRCGWVIPVPPGCDVRSPGISHLTFDTISRSLRLDIPALENETTITVSVTWKTQNPETQLHFPSERTPQIQMTSTFLTFRWKHIVLPLHREMWYSRKLLGSYLKDAHFLSGSNYYQQQYKTFWGGSGYDFTFRHATTDYLQMSTYWSFMINMNSRIRHLFI
jgi:hypothetical protein